MLVIRRKTGEALLLAGGIQVRVLDISPQRVQLGIEAPAEVWVLREEVALAQASNRAAASGVPLSNLSRWAASLRRDAGRNPGRS
jgi:carbon storage regulator